jgi:3-oxoacyl-[acyl-carrier-protein] synthase-3
MKYNKVYIDTISYELAPEVVTSDELEDKLSDMYSHLKMPSGQLEVLTGIYERRWWPAGYRLSDGALVAAKKAIAHSGVSVSDLGAVVYTGVGRDGFEPATACRVAGLLGVNGDCQVYDISNACLGMVSGMIDMANRIELGQIKAGLIISCETARDIVEDAIKEMNEQKQMSAFVSSVATLTGGSGAAAILMTDGSFNQNKQVPQSRLLGGVSLSSSEHFELCRWGLVEQSHRLFKEFMKTDAVGVLKHGVDLGKRTWEAFCMELGWTADKIDKVICHQVGQANQDAMLKLINVSKEKDFATYPFLGNIGTVSLPLTAALAEERGFLKTGDHVGFLGIGSGLNCMMLGVQW